MGNNPAKNLKNYGLTYLPQGVPLSSKQTFPNNIAYTASLLPEQLEAPGYGIKSKTHLNTNNIKSAIFLKPQSLTLLTYNIWFEDHNSQNRYQTIIRMLAESKADIICLQEVNSTFLNLLHQSAALFPEGYDYFMPIMKMHWYDTLILSKYPCRFYKKLFVSSGMGRCNLTAVIEFSQNNSPHTFKLGVNCVHLQSLNCSKQRMAQLGEIETLNTKLDMSIIAGDFNFTDGWEEDKAITTYTDVWKTGKRHFSKWSNEQMRELGYTMPPTPQFPPWRPDHIIYKSKEKDLTKENNEIAIIGDFTVPPYEQQHFTKVAVDSAVRTPSDHFGLISKIYLP